MTTTLPLFWHLSSASTKERIDASVKLVTALERFQAQFVPHDSPETSDDGEQDEQKQDGLDALNAQDVSYSIRRLIRGLASPRESSRLGFAVALTELLSRINTVTCAQIIALIADSSKTQGSMTGQEERDVLFARLFGLTAIIQSTLLVRTSPLPTSTSSTTQVSSLLDYQEILSRLIDLGEKKSWLRESAWWSISLAVDALKASDVPWKGEAVDYTIQSIFVGDKTWSPEKVALALRLQNMHPDKDWRNFMAPTFKRPDLLSTRNLTVLARILSTSEDDDTKDIPKSAAGTWKPQIHFVWDIILNHLLPDPNSATPSKGTFREFFRVVVDESLFSLNASPERKYWGFEVFRKALPRVDSDTIPMLFTKNFMRSWINHLSQKDRYLHKVAKQVATEIESYVQNHPTLGFTLILQLTGVNGSHQFDKLTRTKTVESIFISMDAEGIKSYIDYLFKQVNEDEELNTDKADIATINSRRAWIIDQLSALIRNGATPKSDDWIQSVLNWLIVNGLFVIKKESKKSPYYALRSVPNPAFSEELRQSCRNRLLGCLADLTGQTTIVRSGEKASKVSSVASDGDFWLSKVLKTIEQLEEDTKHLTVLADVSENKTLRLKAREVVAKLQKVTGKQRDAASGAELLLVATLVQQRCADDQGDINTEALEASVDASMRMFFAEGKQSKKRQKPTGGFDETPLEPVDVLVDTIIGYLDHSTAYMRTVGNQVFSLLSGDVKGTTIDLILAQLERRDPTELAKGDDEEMDDDDDDDDDDDESDSGGVSVSHQSNDDDSGDGEPDPDIRRKIEEALRINGIEAATGDSEDDSDEELMDDDQMMAIDEQLATVFRERVVGKKAVKDVDAQREATHFKNRVLDLVDIFIKKQPSSPHIVRLILPLVELVTGTSLDERQLSDKAKGLLKSRIGKIKEVPSGVDTEQATRVISDIHSRACKTHSSDTLEILSQCSLYLTRSLLLSDNEESVLRIYRKSLADFITRKNSTLNTNFFGEFVRRHPTTAWNMRFDLIELTTKAANVFRRCQIFQLFQVLITQLPTMDDRQQEILEFMPSLQQSLFDTASSACDRTVSLTIRQVKDLFKLGLLAIRQTKRIILTPEKIRVIWEPTLWDELHKKLASSERFKSSSALHSMCQQMAHTSQVPSPKEASKAAAKRKAEYVGGDGVDITVSKKTKRNKVKAG